MLCFEWKISKSENVRIFKHSKTLTMSSEKKRNYYDLKEMENVKMQKYSSFIQKSQSFDPM